MYTLNRVSAVLSVLLSVHFASFAIASPDQSTNKKASESAALSSNENKVNDTSSKTENAATGAVTKKSSEGSNLPTASEDLNATKNSNTPKTDTANEVKPKVIKKNEVLAKYKLGDKSYSIDLDTVRAMYLEIAPEGLLLPDQTFDDLPEEQQNLFKEILVTQKMFGDYAEFKKYAESEEYLKSIKMIQSQALLRIMMEKELETEIKNNGGIEKMVEKAYDDLAIQTKGEKQYDLTYIPTKDKKDAEDTLKNLKSGKTTVSALLKQIIGKGPQKESMFKLKGANAYFGNTKLPKETIEQLSKMKNGSYDIIRYQDAYLVIQMNKAYDLKLPTKDKMDSYLKQVVTQKAQQQLSERIKREANFSLVSPVPSETK